MTGRVGHSRNAYDWFAYIAPEIDTDFVHDSRVDLWSLGALLYTLLCGVGPFTGSGQEIIEKKNNGVIKFEIVQPSADAQSLVKSLLRVDPAGRLSVEQILQHEWIKELDENLSQLDLDVALETFRDWGRRMQ